MLAFQRTLSFRYLRQRWPRAALVIASIALGVATLVATRTLNQCMMRAAHSAITPLAKLADLIVTNDETGVRRDLVDELRRQRIPGVAEVRPLVFARVALLITDLDKRSAQLIGAEPGAMAASDSLGMEATTTDAKLWLDPDRRPVLVHRALTEALPQGAKRLRVLANGKVHELEIGGTLEATGPAAALGDSVLGMRLLDAARLHFGRDDSVSRIDIRFAPDADPERVRAQVEAVVAGRAGVRTPEAGDRAVHDVMAGLELGFLLGGLCALVVALFLVYNVLSVTVAERRHDIGILRSLGATRLQVAGLFVVEASLLGLVGAALGVPLGFGLGRALLRPFREVLSDIFMPLEAGHIPVTVESILVAVAAGIITTLVAAVVPALRAANQEPADAVRRVPQRSGWAVRVLHIGGSVALIGGGVLGIALAPYLPPRAGSFGGVCLVLVGILLATPLFAELIARLLAPLTRHLSIEGRLAADNLTRSPGRTGLVIAALAAGVALMFEAAGLTLSSEEAILEWIDQVTAADLFVTCNSPVAASGNSQSMDEEVGRQLAALPLVAAALPVRFQRLDYGKTMIFVTALDAQGYYDRTEDRPWVVGREKFPLLREPGTVLMSENFAVLHHVKVGDTVTLGGPRGPVNLRVVGTVVDYTWNRGTLVLDRQQYVDAFQDAKVDSFDVYLKPGADVNAAREMIANRYAADLSLVVLTRDELRETIRSMVRRLYALSYVQQLLVGLVAGLGVVMALLISVLQRRRELGLLRAVGASRAQVLRSVLAEALLMGLIGALIGLMFGLPLEWYAVRILLTEETGFSFPMRIPWQAAGAVAALALVIATVAGLGPAIHAMRQRIAESIAYE